MLTSVLENTVKRKRQAEIGLDVKSGDYKRTKGWKSAVYLMTMK